MKKARMFSVHAFLTDLDVIPDITKVKHDRGKKSLKPSIIQQNGNIGYYLKEVSEDSICNSKNNVDSK
jgi:hypothetical protein